MLHERPSPSDFARWEELLAAGVEPSSAARGLGFTSSAFRRADPVRHEEALVMSRECRRGFVDERVEQIVLASDAPPAVVLAWARRWNEAYRETQRVEVSGEVFGGSLEELRSLDVGELARRKALILARYPDLGGAPFELGPANGE